MATQEEMDQALTDIGSRVDSVSQDVQTLMKNLDDLRNNPPQMSPEQQAKFDASVQVAQGLVQKLQAVDDLNPNT